MLEVDVKNSHNEKMGTVTLDAQVFGAPVVPELLHEVVQMQRASMRQGTAATKTKGNVRGGGKKPWRQKGTGRARAGSTRSPIWRGGGTTFGPSPRSYAYSIPKKKARKALFSALSSKVAEGALVVLEEWNFSEVKTRAMIRLMDKLALSGRILIAVSQKEDDLVRMSGNIPNLKLIEIRNLDVYSLLLNETLLITQRDLARLVEVWGKS
ncbi:MAG: 50S ribosomal protein L4 [Nitrospirae bacterium]|nr:50S ribosomal protein L4 [Candidatus Manganitrophaceae bacterium]